MRSRVLGYRWIVVCFIALSSGCSLFEPAPGSVILIRPDGASSATWAAARALHVGPDNDMNWDRLEQMALYRGHDVAEPSDDDARPTRIGRRALEDGLSVGLVQTGVMSETGTASYLADAGSDNNPQAITAQLIDSGAQVIMGGGERYLLPQGVHGRHGTGVRSDDRNLINEAVAAGYTVVYDREELAMLRPGTTKLLGVFADEAMFNAQTEEQLAEQGLFLFDTEAPSVAEMTRAALNVLDANGRRFLLVIEEQGTVGFGRQNNAVGVLEAVRRADEAIGVAQRYLASHDDTLLLTAADSDAGGMRMRGIVVGAGQAIPEQLPERESNGSPIDGIGGTGGTPFIAQPDRSGARRPFYICWASGDDVAGGILVRAQGYHSEQVTGSMNRADLAELMRYTLFGD